MRIGIDIRSLSANKHSGVEEYIYNLLPELFRVGKDDEFILFYNSFREPLTKKVQKWGKMPNVEIIDYRLPSKILNLCLWAFRLPQLDKLLKNLDVIFFPNITFSSVSQKTPFVITFHDLSYELFPNFFNFYRRLWHFLINPRKKAQEAAKIIAVSCGTAEDIINLYKVERKKIYPIPLGLSPLFTIKEVKKDKNSNTKSPFLPLIFWDSLVSPIQKKKNEDLLKRRYQLPGRPFILYLGTIEPRKNLPTLIKAFNLYKQKTGSQFDLVIAGAAGWSYEDVFAQARRSPYKENIYFPGPIRNIDRPLLYKTASLFVFPSFFEGFGLPPLEAMAVGTPVICSASTSLLEIFGDHALMANPHDIGELAWAIERLLADNTLSKSLSEEGKKFAQKFSWEKTAEKTLAVLHEAAQDT
ncbi:MAG: glycosyltransferase family 1 protein [Candidatus Moraniibacteriota bacterium]